MIRTGESYRESIRDGRQVWIDGEKVRDVPTHPVFKPIVDVRARMYDMAHEAEYRELLAYHDGVTGELNNMFYKPPRSRQDWQDKRDGVEAVMRDIGGVVTRVGDETIGEVWSLYDGQEMLNATSRRTRLTTGPVSRLCQYGSKR
jgi:4-hydroxyphenylacetate 3-monooxygenase